MKVSEYLLRAWRQQSMTYNFVCKQVLRVFKTVIWKKEQFFLEDKISFKFFFLLASKMQKAVASVELMDWTNLILVD